MANTHTTDTGIDYVRTPDEQFSNLEGFPYAPNYADVDGLRMGYIDEGQADDPVMCAAAR